MKTIISLMIILLISPFSTAETKEELVEKVIEVSNAEVNYAKATSALMETVKRARGDDDIDELFRITREYCRTNGVRPLYTSALDETFSEEELEILIKYYESFPPEYEQVLSKLNTDFQVSFAMKKIEWTERLFTVINATYDSQQNTNKTPDQIYIDRVLDAQESRNYTNALHMLNEKIQYEEWQLQFMYELRGDCFFEFEEYEKARDEYIKALPRTNEGNIEYRLGQTYDVLGEFQTAVSYYDKCLKLAPAGGLQEALAYYRKGRSLAALGKYEDAESELRKIKRNKNTMVIMTDVREMIRFCMEQEGLINSAVQP